MPQRTTQPSANPIAQKEVRTGTTSLLITDLTKAVTFAQAMPSANYQVTFEVGLAIGSCLGVQNKTTAGFDIKSVGVALAVCKWRVVED